MPKHKSHINRLIICAIATLTITQVKADINDLTAFSIDDIIADIYENIDEDRQFEKDFDVFYENFISLNQNPININQATQEQLEQLLFLSDEQIDDILLYIYRYGPLQSIYELQLINSLHSYDIRDMLPFIYIGEKKDDDTFKWRDIIDKGKHEVLFRIDLRNAEKTKAIRQQYIGDPLYSYLKYKYNLSDKIELGLHAEKDVGEQFWGPTYYGFDKYGGYLQIRDLWKFKTIVIGDYKANFGEGLVVNQMLRIGKAYNPLTIKNRNKGLQKYGGNDEFNFFRGIGATAGFGNFEVSAFYSFKNLDAKIANNIMTTYYTNGYHRTETELSHRNTNQQHVIGLDATYKNRYIDIGVTFLENILQYPMKSSEKEYFHGKNQTIGSVHYHTHYNSWAFFGETALASNRKLGVATLNGIKYHPIANLGFVIAHRYYSKYFDNMYANALSYKSRLNNEQTIYFATDINLLRDINFSVSTDIWKQYQNIMVVISHERFEQYSIKFQSRWKHRDNQHRISGKLNFDYAVGALTLRSIAEGNISKKEKQRLTYGAEISQKAEYRFLKPNIVLQACIGYVYAPNYDNRFYISENDILYAYSQNMIYGNALRSYLNIRYSISNNWKIYLKISNTYQIEKTKNFDKSRTDLHLLLRYTY